MVFASSGGCYYGVLNVLDPSVHYDSDGKVTGALRLPPAEDAPILSELNRHQQQQHQQRQSQLHHQQQMQQMQPNRHQQLQLQRQQQQLEQQQRMEMQQQRQLQLQQQTMTSSRNEAQDYRRGSSDYREVQEIIVVETVESVQEEPPIIRGPSVDILDVTAVEDPGPDYKVLKRKVDSFPEDERAKSGYKVPLPEQEPIPLFDAEELSQEPSVKSGEADQNRDALQDRDAVGAPAKTTTSTREQKNESPVEPKKEESFQPAVAPEEGKPAEESPKVQDQAPEPKDKAIEETKPETQPESVKAKSETEGDKAEAKSTKKKTKSKSKTEAKNETKTESKSQPKVLPAEEARAEEARAEEARAEEAKAEEAKTEEVKTEEVTEEPARTDEDDGVVEESPLVPGTEPAFVPLSQYRAPTEPVETRAPPAPTKPVAPVSRAPQEPEPIFVEDQSLVQVVDYRESTPLFTAVSKKNWQGVLYYLRTGAFSFSTLSSVNKEAIKRQAQTWVAKRDFQGTELWRQLPLHAAICFGAPFKVIEKLIEVNPGALKSPDCYGNLPLHLAFIFDASDHVTSHLMTAFPASIHVMNFEGLQPIQCSKEISSEAFQSNAELFGALSDYTRAVAENDPDKLIEQLQDVKTQLKAVNDTLFAKAPVRKPELIKEVLKPSANQEQRAIVADYGPGAFIREIAVAAGICSMAPVEEDASAGVQGAGIQRTLPPRTLPEVEKPHRQEVVVLQDVPTGRHAPSSFPQQQTCRVMEYCPKTKSWKEV